MTTDVSPEAGFARRREGYEQARERQASTSRRLSRGRTLAFLLGAGLLLAADVLEGPGGAWLAWAGIVAGVVFLGLVVLHRRSRRTEAWYGRLSAVCDEGMARLARRWDDLPQDPSPPAPVDHLFARDLDLFGRASVMQLLGSVGTDPGRSKLRGWLLGGSEADQLPPRQEAVSELADLPAFREAWTARARKSEPSGDVTDTVLLWAGGDIGAPIPAVASWMARVIPLLTLALFAVELSLPRGQPYWLIPLMVGIGVLRRWKGEIDTTFAGAGVGESSLSRREDLVREAEGLEPHTPRLREIRGAMGRGDESASRGLRRLGQWVSLAEVRLSQLHFPLNVLFLWDIHVAVGLDRWRARWGHRVEAWIEGLATLDALAALGALAHENPDWAFPTFVEEPLLRAEGLGHPLLPPPTCVRNDVTVGPPGSVLVVTGSNMSGKSTLLRAIGVNAVLARAGAPVCARRLSLPLLTVATCMRVEDSLADGTSLFMAELERLKRVVEAASGEGPALILLDEILHGTNTAERQIAARTVLRTLAESQAISAVSTHDLELIDPPDLRAISVSVHFTEEVSRAPDGTPTIHFDYLLRPGLATSTNALTLLEVVGLRPPEPGP